MSQRAIKFFGEFVIEHINPLPYPEHGDEAERLRNECLAEAKKQGISEAEIVEDLTQDLTSEFIDQLGDRVDEEIARLAAKGD